MRENPPRPARLLVDLERPADSRQLNSIRLREFIRACNGLLDKVQEVSQQIEQRVHRVLEQK